MDTEHRRILGIEWRADPDDGPGTLAGAVMRYGEIADLPWGRERFEPGSLYLDPAGVVLNRQHDRRLPLARYPAAGLNLEMSTVGVSMRARVADTTDGRDTVALVRQGVLRGLSVEFVPEREHSEGDLRIIDRARLVGVAVVDSGAYDGATVEAMRAKHAGRPGRILGAHWGKDWM